jgi:hypothetical protein
MRTSSYVKDSLGVLAWPPLADVIAVYRAVQNLKLQPS